MSLDRRTMIRITLAGAGFAAASCHAAKVIERGEGLWARSNLAAWAVVPFDTRHRDPNARARMLSKLGFTKFAYDWRPKHIPSFDAEIKALKRQQIELIGWWFPFNADDPQARSTLEIFKSNNVRPQAWAMQAITDMAEVIKRAAKLLPKGMPMPQDADAFSALPPDKLAIVQKALTKAMQNRPSDPLPKTPDEQRSRVMRECERIERLAALARPYGVAIALYNHGDWYGDIANQAEMMVELQRRGIDDVCIVYNFSHARDEMHDDTKRFDTLWPRIAPYVTTVNVAGVHMEDGTALLPSQGDSELDMMRVIERSGWRGHVGVIAESGGDAEHTLQDARRGLEWLACELHRSGNCGPAPFPKKAS